MNRPWSGLLTGRMLAQGKKWSNARRAELLNEPPRNPFERTTCGGRRIGSCRLVKSSGAVVTAIRFKLFARAILLLVLAVLQSYIAAEGIAIRWEREKVYPIYFEYLGRAAEGVDGAYF